jgi:hypothetical protein
MSFNIQFSKKDERLILVSLTTSPSRLLKLKKVINSIKRQTLLPSKIILNLPDKFGRTNEEYLIPEWIENDNFIYVNRCGEDYGPITKIFPTLFLSNNPETIIISIDDDIEYSNKLVEEFVKHSLCYDVVFSTSNFNLIKNGEIDLSRRHFGYYNIIEGYGGIIYKRKFFQNDFFDYFNYIKNNRDCFFSDDLIISNYLSMKRIGKVCINNIYLDVKKNKILAYGNSKDALHNGANLNLYSNFKRYKLAKNFLIKNKIYYIRELFNTNIKTYLTPTKFGINFNKFWIKQNERLNIDNLKKIQKYNNQLKLKLNPEKPIIITNHFNILVKDFSDIESNLLIYNKKQQINKENISEEEKYENDLEDISKKMVDNIISDVIKQIKNENKLKVDLIDENTLNLYNNLQPINVNNNIVKHDKDLFKKTVILI